MPRIQIPEDLIRFLGITVLAGFGFGVFYAGYITHCVTGAPQPDKMPAFANWVLSSLNGTLALNLGAYLGIKGVGQSLAGPIGWLQKWAAIVYVAAVVVSLLLWSLAELTEDMTKVAAILPEVSRSGVGIILALFGAGLGVKFTTDVRAQRTAG